MTILSARLLQLAGAVVALVGLAGFWLSRDVPRNLLDEGQQAVLNVPPGEFQASFVVAGRDFDHVREAGTLSFVGGRCVRSRPGEFVVSRRTDTILFVSIIGNRVRLISIPRDIYLPEWQTKINAMYLFQGAEGLKRSVSEVVGLPIDYYVVINLTIFERLVDALGGVSVNVPYRMDYQDCAAALVIDLQPGPQRLSGEQAAGFVRFRQTPRGDLDRVENLKTLAHAVLVRLKELNVWAVGTLPAVIDTFFDEVETNASPALATQLLPRLAQLDIHAATLPTVEIAGSASLAVNPRQVESFMADFFGGRARTLAELPEAPLLITNRSGVPGLETQIKDRLVRLGVPADRLVLREAGLDPTPTRVLATAERWQDARYYAELFHAGQQQSDRLPVIDGVRAGMELILGQDAQALADAKLVAREGGYDRN
ncbi:MAG: LCP family protein [Truepera sp.]|nr:LCP family protein [Truepera sp.]